MLLLFGIFFPFYVVPIKLWQPWRKLIDKINRWFASNLLHRQRLEFRGDRVSGAVDDHEDRALNLGRVLQLGLLESILRNSFGRNLRIKLKLSNLHKCVNISFSRPFSALQYC
jgi:hypothetical protein